MPAVDQPSRFSHFSARRRAATILILGGLWTIGSFATDLYLPAMPATAEDLGASTQAVAFSVTTFLIGLAFGQLLAGPLSDTYGRRRTLLAGLVVFTASALVCVLAPSVEVLIAVRFVQGVAGAFGLAIPSAVITDYSRGREAARLFSRVALIGGIAPIMAPLIGAQLLNLSGWRGPFVALTVIGLLLTASVAVGLPESLPPRETRGARDGARPARHGDAVARPRLHGLRRDDRPRLRRLLRLSDGLVVRVSGRLRRLGDDVQRPLRGERRRHAGGHPGQPPVARPLLSPAAARRGAGGGRGRGGDGAWWWCWSAGSGSGPWRRRSSSS